MGDRHGEAATLVNIGDIYAMQGRYADALEHYETAVTILRAEGDRAGEGTTINSIAKAYLAQGRYAQALEQFESAAAIARTLGDRAGEGRHSTASVWSMCAGQISRGPGPV